MKKEGIRLLEMQSQLGNIDLYYGDESGVNQLAYVPYGWQFKDEKIGLSATHGKQINCFGLLSRNNNLLFELTEKTIDSEFVVSFLDQLSFSIQKKTVIILDNARIHTSYKIKNSLSIWQKRGLFIFYLPPYSPHLNIIERLWKELKARWLKPEDYNSFDELKYATRDCLLKVGSECVINFKQYS